MWRNEMEAFAIGRDNPSGVARGEREREEKDIKELHRLRTKLMRQF